VKNPQLTTFAQRIWRDDVLTGRSTVEEGLRVFCDGVKDSDLFRQIDSMPADMLSALNQFVTPLPAEDGGMGKAAEVSKLFNIELDAFNGDFEATLRWKRQRFEKIYSAIQDRLRRQSNV
jgi:hypothetical protein